LLVSNQEHFYFQINNGIVKLTAALLVVLLFTMPMLTGCNVTPTVQEPSTATETDEAVETEPTDGTEETEQHFLAIDGTEFSEPQPLVYQKNAQDEGLFVAKGEKTVKLEGAYYPLIGEETTFNGTFSYDYRYLYYLADVDGKTGEGNLMVVDLDAETLVPERIVESVCFARISRDGKGVLFLKNYNVGYGDLYWCEVGGEPMFVDSSVYEENFYLFSGGKSFCLLVCTQ